MNPSSPTSPENPGMQLPAPMEQATPPGMPPETGQTAVETGRPAAPEVAPSAQTPPPIAPPTSLPIPPITLPQQPTQVDVSGTTPVMPVPIADDGDLIEKEWVHKAKRIVEETRDDPYKQSEELTMVKADYMKQRYNKTIKLNK